MINACQNCRWSFMTWGQTAPDKMPVNHLRCWPDEDHKREQVAEIPCLKWQLDEGETVKLHTKRR